MSPEIGFTKKHFVHSVIRFIQMQSNEGINNFKNSSSQVTTNLFFFKKKVRNLASMHEKWLNVSDI